MESFNKYVVNLSHLKFNYKQIKNCVGKNVKVCAMVKADAYGHGLKDVCKALSCADFFGVCHCYDLRACDQEIWSVPNRALVSGGHSRWRLGQYDRPDPFGLCGRYDPLGVYDFPHL